MQLMVRWPTNYIRFDIARVMEFRHCQPLLASWRHSPHDMITMRISHLLETSCKLLIRSWSCIWWWWGTYRMLTSLTWIFSSHVKQPHFLHWILAATQNGPRAWSLSSPLLQTTHHKGAAYFLSFLLNIFLSQPHRSIFMSINQLLLQRQMCLSCLSASTTKLHPPHRCKIEIPNVCANPQFNNLQTRAFHVPTTKLQVCSNKRLLYCCFKDSIHPCKIEIPCRSSNWKNCKL